MQQSRNLVRASNEVLAAAGIIETEEGFRKRDVEKIKERDAREEDIQKAYRRRAYGQVALTSGVWGACGLRRRIEVSEACFDITELLISTALQILLQPSSFGPHQPRTPIIFPPPHIWCRSPRTDAQQRYVKPYYVHLSILTLPPAIGNLAHFITINPFSPLTKTLTKYTTNYIMFHYKYFAILQQLNLVPSSFPHFIVPPLSFMVPFSAASPFYLPTLPAVWTMSTTLEFVSKAALVVAPIVFLQLWYRISNSIISTIYDPIYSLLPHPSNLAAAEKLEREAAAAAAEALAHTEQLAEQFQRTISRGNRSDAPSPEADLVVVNEDDEAGVSDETDGNSTTTWNEDDFNELPPRPSNPTPTSDPITLRALEGRAERGESSGSDNNLRGGATVHDTRPHHDQHQQSRERRYSYASTESSNGEATTTTLITFDVEATDEPTGGNDDRGYSAELRQAPSSNDQGLRGGATGGEDEIEVPTYDVTAMSIMPAHLFADGVTVLMSTACTVLLEMMMVRSVAASWLGRKSGGGSWAGTAGTWPVLTRKGHRLPWFGWANIGLVFMGDLVMTGMIWGGCMLYMTGFDWLERRIRLIHMEMDQERKGVKEHEV